MAKFFKGFVLALVLCLFSTQAFAGWLWNKKLVKIQQNETSAFIAVSNADGSAKKNYAVSSTHSNTLLAIALTAMSLGKTVHVELTGSNVTSIVLSDE